MDAINNPTRRATREINTGDMKVGQKPNIVLPDEGPLDIQAESIAAVLDGNEHYYSDLAFNEEPMTIRVEKSADKFAPKTVDCWVNGKGVEVFLNGQWKSLGWLPVGVPVVTRRKYVEVLARAKPDTIQTEVEDAMVAQPRNEIARNTSTKYPFSVIEDKNPRGAAWLSKILMEG
jgi:hypothetical protein